MADEMDKSLGKEEKKIAPEAQPTAGLKARPDVEGVAEGLASKDAEGPSASASSGQKVAENVAGLEAAKDNSTAQPAAPEAKTFGSVASASEAPTAPSDRSEPVKAEAGSAKNQAVDHSPEVFGGLGKAGLDLLYDVELDATLQFGSKEMLLRDVLELGPGDVVELDRHIAEPVDLVVGDRIVARGEVVVASGNFALRVTEVATPQMRLESIRCLF